MEYAILPLLIWTEATLLANFGNAKLWPIYIYFANISKYYRGRPTEFLAQHLAYIPSVRFSLHCSLHPCSPTLSFLTLSKMHT